MPVIVKELMEDAEPELVEAFIAEAKSMITIEHKNVLRMIGCLLEGSAKKIVYEEYANGVLKPLLVTARKNNSVTPVEQIRMAADIAGGMLYLSDHAVVHGDLAARSCLVDNFKRVRVGDYGLVRQKNAGDYTAAGKKKLLLPVRWMAPESLAEATQHVAHIL